MTELELFAKMVDLVRGRPNEMVCQLALNLIVSALREISEKRSEAEANFDVIMARGKGLLLDKNYDAVTGRRRNVVPVDHVIEVPFHNENNVIYPPR